MLVLGIETTCDETSVGIVQSGKEILSLVTASQSSLHKLYGGVFPELASREHARSILPVIHEALAKAKISPSELSLLSVANEPGLMGSLLVGSATAKALSFAWNLPLIGVHHVMAHSYAAMMCAEEPIYPSIGLIVSGGHTLLCKISAVDSYTVLGSTIDDAMGESFDKVAGLLGLPYPGGPQIERLARGVNTDRYRLTPGRVREKPFSFSFSGLKTQVLYNAKGQNSSKNHPCILNDQEKRELAASFQQIVCMDVIEKTLLARQMHGCRAIYIGGGVAQNLYFQTLFREKAGSTASIYFPSPDLCADNGAMIAGLAYHLYLKKSKCEREKLVCRPTGSCSLFSS